jgi:hypothetical protein
MMMLAAAAVVVPSVASAQTSASANMTVSANVIKGITLAKTSAAAGLDFSTVVAGTTPTAIAATGASAIAFEADGQASQGITITYSTATLLSGANQLTFTPSVVSGAANVQGSATAVTSGDATRSLSGTGKHYFWVGGSLGAIGAAQAAGTYSGSWSMTVAYTGL